MGYRRMHCGYNGLSKEAPRTDSSEREVRLHATYVFELGGR